MRGDCSFCLYWWNCWPSLLHFLSITCYDFRIQMMFGSSMHPVVCRRVHVAFTLFFCLCIVVINTTLCCVFLFCLSSSCVLCAQCCQFLWIDHAWLLSSVFSNVYVHVCWNKNTPFLLHHVICLFLEMSSQVLHIIL